MMRYKLFALALVVLLGVADAQATYTQQFTLAQDTVFQGQVMVAMLTAATQIMAEANTVAGHSARASFAVQVLANPTKFQPILAFAVVTQGGITPLTVPSTVADSALQTAMNSIWNAEAGYFAN